MDVIFYLNYYTYMTCAIILVGSTYYLIGECCRCICKTNNDEREDRNNKFPDYHPF